MFFISVLKTHTRYTLLLVDAFFFLLSIPLSRQNLHSLLSGTITIKLKLQCTEWSQVMVDYLGKKTLLRGSLCTAVAGNGNYFY